MCVVLCSSTIEAADDHQCDDDYNSERRRLDHGEAVAAGQPATTSRSVAAHARAEQQQEVGEEAASRTYLDEESLAALSVAGMTGKSDLLPRRAAWHQNCIGTVDVRTDVP
jgi:hypothetical protein